MKYFFLSLLSREPTHGYDLLRTYESLFSTVLPPLNAGQIYTTLSRLERDGLVHKFAVEQEGKPNKQVYELTEQGRQILLVWFDEPLTGPRIKDNFYLKLMSARMTDLVDPRHLIRNQRGQYLQTLHDLNALALQPEMVEDPARLLLVQGAVLHLRADLEWLDLCEDPFIDNDETSKTRRKPTMSKISYRWMEPNEVSRIGEIDRSERIRTGYTYINGSLQKLEVQWDTPNFLIEGTGDHTVAAQIVFCSAHLSRNGRMVGAFEGTKLIGMGIVQHEIRPGLSQLASLHVSNKYRRRGIGSRLARELIDEARRAGAKKMYVSATPSGSAVGFYRSHGFRPTDTPVPELYKLEPEDIHMIMDI